MQLAGEQRASQTPQVLPPESRPARRVFPQRRARCPPLGAEKSVKAPAPDLVSAVLLQAAREPLEVCLGSAQNLVLEAVPAAARRAVLPTWLRTEPSPKWSP
jgi:hypothetical protein